MIKLNVPVLIKKNLFRNETVKINLQITSYDCKMLLPFKFDKLSRKYIRINKINFNKNLISKNLCCKLFLPVTANIIVKVHYETSNYFCFNIIERYFFFLIVWKRSGKIFYCKISIELFKHNALQLSRQFIIKELQLHDKFVSYFHKITQILCIC